MSGKPEKDDGMMVRINPTVYEQMRIAAKNDGRSIAKEIDWACREFLRLNHPGIVADSVELPPKKDHPKGKD